MPHYPSNALPKNNLPHRLVTTPWTGLLMLWSVFATAVVVIHIQATAQALIAFSFLLICPGAAVTGLTLPFRGLRRLVFGIGLSIAIEMIMAEIMVYAHTWSLDGAIIGLAALTLATAGAELFGVAPPFAREDRFYRHAGAGEGAERE